MNAQFITRRARAEQSVLGGLLLDNSKWPEISPLINEDSFSCPTNKIVFTAIKRQLQAGEPADVVTVSGMEGIDLAYTGLLAKDTPSADNIGAYARVLIDGLRREKMAVMLASAQKSLLNDEPLDDITRGVVEYAEKSMFNKSKEGFMFTSIKDIVVQPIDWLVEDFLETNALVEVFGAPESGKSLLAIDWGLSVAAGIPWLGSSTQKGAVFYIAGEGHNGLSRRFSAWGISNAVDINTLDFYPSLQAAAFYNKQSAVSVERSISDVASKNAVTPRLIIIDTLARNFGGNENSTEDMNLFIAHIDTHLRIKFNCTVLLVHHTGHGAAERGRGSSALKAAVDTEYSLSKSNANTINLNCTKMKDAAHPAPKSFTIRSVDLGIDDEKGHAANGAVLVETLYAEPEPKEKPLAENQITALDALDRLTNEHRNNFEREGKKPDDAKVTEKLWREQLGDMKSYTYRDTKDGLVKRGLISLEDGFVHMN